MNAAELRELLDREPFEPFRLILTSGTSYDIRSPGLVVAMKRQAFIAFSGGDRWTFCPYLHVAAVEAIPPNGRPRRQRRQ